MLKHVVEEYVRSATPVSSEVIVRRYEPSVSSATVRNELSQLEDLGLISHPHTSAGLLQFFNEFTAEQTLIAAAIGITAAPLVLLYLFTQRYIIAGMTSGAIKG